MANAKPQSISISEFAELCAGSQVKVERAIDGWYNETDKERVQQLAMGGGGTSASLPREDVVQMFQLGVLAIDENKIKLTHFRRKYDELKARHGLSDEELRPKAA